MDRWDELRAEAALTRRRSAELRDAAAEAGARADVRREGRLELELRAIGVNAELRVLAEELAEARRRVANLELALQTNRRIAMAIGIIMARRGLPEDGAFEVLREASQQTHRKLRDIADDIVYTGVVPNVS